MKLIYSTSALVTTLSLHIILVHILFIQSAFTSSSSSPKTSQIGGSGDEHEEESANLHMISEENKKIIIEQAKASLLKVLGLKEVPKQPKKRAVVPQAMLEEYRKSRELVRDTIPNDRDFYGKINVHDLEKRHVDFWSAVYNTYGGYDIEVDMDGDDNEGSRFLYKGEYDRLSLFRLQSEPEDIPKSIEHALPPHSFGGTTSQKQFISVHLRFNLSQELFTNPLSINDIKAAELHLTREKITSDSIDSDKVPLIYTDKSSERKPPGEEKTATEKGFSNKFPRYQRVYVLHVYGYDEHKEPMTRIHDSQLIDIHRSTPLIFDINHIVKRWISNPADNYGIIIRVTREDKDTTSSTNQQIKTTNTTPNASLQNLTQETPVMTLEEHVRLKRGFQSTSEIDEVWNQKQPSIFIFSGLPEGRRRHVKRQYSPEVIEDVQADQPQITNQYNHNTAVRPPTSVSGRSQRNRPRPKTTRRAEKCSMKSLEINFDDVGWSSWIIAPQSYFANYCLGDCSYPLGDMQNATNHAIIQSIFHSVGRVVPKSCCAPTKLGNMKILYQLDGVVQMREYDDMTVVSCGCL